MYYLFSSRIPLGSVTQRVPFFPAWNILQIALLHIHLDEDNGSIAKLVTCRAGSFHALYSDFCSAKQISPHKITVQICTAQIVTLSTPISFALSSFIRVSHCLYSVLYSPWRALCTLREVARFRIAHVEAYLEMRYCAIHVSGTKPASRCQLLAAHLTII